MFDWLNDRNHPACCGLGFLLGLLGVALIVSSVAWPVAWYHVSVARAGQEESTKMAEMGYEQVAERPDARSDVRVTWRKINEAKK
jgi:hypothetical protein